VERIYVHQKIYGAFVDAFVAEVKRFKVGDPLDESSYIGPLTRRPQLEVLRRQVADAKRKGATLLAGGGTLKGKGNWFEPTVFVNVDHRMSLMKDESFGPIILVGAGGLYTETLADTAVALAPVDEVEAEQLLRSLRCAPLLLGARGRPALDLAAAARALAALSRFAAERPEVAEVEINPLLVRREGAVGLDARIVLA